MLSGVGVGPGAAGGGEVAGGNPNGVEPTTIDTSFELASNVTM